MLQVARVWKGEVGTTFEMPAYEEAAACWGFDRRWLKVGNDLLVVASSLTVDPAGTPIFETGICSRTAFAAENKDIEELGPGYDPAARAKRLGLYLALAILIAIVAPWVVYRVRSRAPRG